MVEKAATDASKDPVLIAAVEGAAAARGGCGTKRGRRIGSDAGGRPGAYS